jgi:Uncharacterized conserved protein containing a ferredoxin-like domain
MSWEEAINRVISHGIPRVYEILERHPYLPELASKLRKAREEVIKNLDHYIEMTMKSVQRTGGKAYLANDAKEAREIVGKIVGTGKRVVLGKSMVAFEIGLRKYLQSLGNEVWETDLGELLLQLTDDNPSHIIGPAIHMTKERVAKVLREKIGADVSESSTHEELVAAARKFLREKFLTADVGITGANAVAADTGSIVLVENEGNIRLSSSVPPVHISVTGVEKIVPTLEYAVIEALVQSAYWGLYPPTYVNLTSGPSSTADIEHKRVSPAHGPKEFHLVLIDNGRREIAKDPDLWEGRTMHKVREVPPPLPGLQGTGREVRGTALQRPHGSHVGLLRLQGPQAGDALHPLGQLQGRLSHENQHPEGAGEDKVQGVEGGRRQGLNLRFLPLMITN